MVILLVGGTESQLSLLGLVTSKQNRININHDSSFYSYLINHSYFILQLGNDFETKAITLH